MSFHASFFQIRQNRNTSSLVHPFAAPFSDSGVFYYCLGDTDVDKLVLNKKITSRPRTSPRAHHLKCLTIGVLWKDRLWVLGTTLGVGEVEGGNVKDDRSDLCHL